MHGGADGALGEAARQQEARLFCPPCRVFGHLPELALPQFAGALGFVLRQAGLTADEFMEAAK